MIVYLAAVASARFQEKLFEFDDAHEKALNQLGQSRLAHLACGCRC